MAKTKKTSKKDSKKAMNDIAYIDFIIDDTLYKTLTNKKFEQRKPYAAINENHITSFMPGNIQKIYVNKGDEVKEGDKLLILEAMKMKNIISAPFDGKVKKVNVKQGDVVPKNCILLELK